ncbi:hypothetical protein SVAN01_11615 [Stagonosporopsis vannaccii]|nr:hypothetical protein SVAN01_11615 [Stagonosporopsis vannaccii]
MAVEHDKFELAQELLNFSSRTLGGLPSPFTCSPRALEVTSSRTRSAGGPTKDAGLYSGLAAFNPVSPGPSRASTGPSPIATPHSETSASRSSRPGKTPALFSPTPVQSLPQLDEEVVRPSRETSQSQNVAVVIPAAAAAPAATAASNRPNAAATAATTARAKRLHLRSHRSPQPGAAYAREWILESRMGYCQISRDRKRATVRSWGLARETDFRKAVKKRIHGYGRNPDWLKAWADLPSKDGKTSPFEARCVASQLFKFQPKYTASSGNPGFACDACINQRQLCIRKLRFNMEEKLVLYSLPQHRRVTDTTESGPRRIGYYIRGREE